MKARNRWTRSLVLFPMAVAVSLLAACDESPTDDDHDPADEIASLRITIGSSTPVVLNSDNNAVISGTVPVVIGAGTHNISVEYLDDAGVSLNSELAAEFEVRVTPLNVALVTFARTGAFAGTLTRVAPGSTTLEIDLFHIPAGHADIERTLLVTIQ